MKDDDAMIETSTDIDGIENGLDKHENHHHHQNDSNGEDVDIIEIDYGMIDSAKAKRVKNLHVTERFLKTSITGKRTARELKRIFADIQRLDSTMDSMYVQLEETQITGAHLALAITPNLSALHVQSGLILQNQDDRQAFGRVIYEHDSLTEIKLHNLVIREGMVARWSKDPPPPLDILVPAFTSIVFLTTLELSRQPDLNIPGATGENGNGASRKKPMLSLLGIKELCQSLTLQRLNLTNVGLTDEHFGMLVEQLSQSTSSCLTELILNENDNTDHGVDMLASLLFKADCKLEKVECYQSDSVVNGRSVEMLTQALHQNATLTTLRLHLWGDDPDDDGDHRPSSSSSSSKSKGVGGRLKFYLRLNRAGRKHLISKSCTREQWLSVIENVKDEPDLLYYCFKNSTHWWSMYDPNRPLVPIAKMTATNGENSSNGKQLEELKNRYSDIVNGLEVQSSNGENGGENKQTDGSNKSMGIDLELDAKHLPKTVCMRRDGQQKQQQEEGEGDDAELHNSIISTISLGAESYIQDLLNQKKERARHAREEILEDALIELDYALENDKLPPGMSEENFFGRVVNRLTKQREKEEIARERKLDKLLERELLKVAAARENAARHQEQNGKSVDEK